MAPNCRRCRWFMRVREFDDGIKSIWPRGFCVLGMGEGDFSLYASYSGRCSFYEEDDVSRKIYEVEEAITKIRTEYWAKAHDRRTRIHRLAKKRAGIKGRMGLYDILKNSDYWRAVWAIFEEENADLIKEVKEIIRLRSISFEDYCTLIGGITEAVKEFFEGR